MSASSSCDITTEVGGYDNDFDPEVDRKYKCPVCLAVLRDPVQTTCGHRFCSTCLRGVVSGDTANFARCPVDNLWLKYPEEVFTDNATRREVLCLSVRCEQAAGDDRCDWKGELREVQEHLKTCSLVEVPCKFECGETVSRGHIEAHTGTCKKRPVLCWHCEVKLPLPDIPKHQLLECQMFPVTCSVCGGVGIIRKNIRDHWKNFCPLVKVPCQYSKLGCQAEEKRQNLGKHLKDNLVDHTSLMLSRMLTMETKMNTLITRVDQVQRTLASLHSIVAQVVPITEIPGPQDVPAPESST